MEQEMLPSMGLTASKQRLLLNRFILPLSIKYEASEKLTMRIDLRNITDFEIDMFKTQYEYPLSQAREVQLIFGSKSKYQETNILAFCLTHLKNAIKLSIIFEEGVISSSNKSQLGIQLKKLPYLEELEIDIYENNTILEENAIGIGQALEQMKNLKILKLSFRDSVQIEPSKLRNILNGIKVSKCMNSIQIKLGKNNLVQDLGIKVIEQSLEQLKQLLQLDIEIGEANGITAEGVKSIHQILQNASQLTILKLSILEKRSVANQQVEQICLQLRNLHFLQQIHLIINSMKTIPSSAFQILSESLNQLKFLSSLQLFIQSNQSLNIDKNSNSHPMNIIIQGLASLNLIKIHLTIENHSNFNSEQMHLFSQNLKKIKGIQDFSLDIQEGNLLSLKSRKNQPKQKKGQKSTQQKEDLKETENLSEQKQEINEFLESLENLKNLQKFQLIIDENNNITEANWGILSNLSNLIYLKLKISNSSKFTDQSMSGLTKAFANLKLISLNLDIGEANEAAESAWTNMTSSLSSQSQLEELALSIGRYNECGDKSMKQLGISLTKILPLKKLTIVLRGDNNISEDGLIAIWNELQFSQQLESLQFEFHQTSKYEINNLLSTASSTLRQLQKLNSLSLILNSSELKTFCAFEVKHALQLGASIISLSNLNILHLQLGFRDRFIGSSSYKLQSMQDEVTFKEGSDAEDYLLKLKSCNSLWFKLFLKKGDLKEIGQGIQSLPNLISNFTIKSNSDQIKKPTNPTMNILSDCLSKLNSIINLKLGREQMIFSDAHIFNLFKSISAMRNIRTLELDLQIEKITMKASEILSTEVHTFTQLKQVRIEFKIINISTPSTQALASLIIPFLQLKQLKNIRFEVNSFINLTIERKPNYKSNEAETQFNLQQLNIFPSGDDCFYNLGILLLNIQVDKQLHIMMDKTELVSLEQATMLAKGIENQIFLLDIELKFKEMFIITGKGVEVLSKALTTLQSLNYFTFNMCSDQHFSVEQAFNTTINLCLTKASRFKQFEINGREITVNQKETKNLSIPIMLLCIEKYKIISINFNQLFNCINKIIINLSLQEILQDIDRVPTLSSFFLDTSKISFIHKYQIPSNLPALSMLDNIIITHSITQHYSLGEGDQLNELQFLQNWIASQVNLVQLSLTLENKMVEQSSQITNSDFQQLQPQPSNNQSPSYPNFFQFLLSLKKQKNLQLTLLNFGLLDGGFDVITSVKKMVSLQSLKLFLDISKQLQYISEESLMILNQYLVEDTAAKNLKKFELTIQCNDSIPQDTILFFMNSFKKNFANSKDRQLLYYQVNMLSHEIKHSISQQIGQVEKIKSLSIQHLTNSTSYSPFLLNQSKQNMNSNEVEIKFNHSIDYMITLPSYFQKNSNNIQKAIVECQELLLLLLNQENQDMKSIEVTFNFKEGTNQTPEFFLQQLFSILHLNKRFLTTLIVRVAFEEKFQFDYLCSTVLKGITNVNKLHLIIPSNNNNINKNSLFAVSFPDTPILENFRGIEYLDTIKCLVFQINKFNVIFYQKIKNLAFKLMKRLVQLEVC